MSNKTKSGSKAKKPATATRQPDSNPIHRPPAQEISESIIALIEKQVFVPGERLREQDLADRFNVTRGRIREALHILEARGFVEIERMKGATITRHDTQEYIAIGEIRSALMALAVKRAAAHASDSERAEILKVAKELADRGPDMPPQDFRPLTVQLGTLICRAARSPYLLRLINDAHRARLYRILSVASRARRVQSSRNWLRVAEAINERDGALAAKTVEKIYEQALTAIMEAIAAE